MRIRWFGESWGAPVCEKHNRVEAPVGKNCLVCELPIENGDQGLVTGASPGIHEAFETTIDKRVYLVCVYHRGCFEQLF